jgi:C1A family cysteine protease
VVTANALKNVGGGIMDPRMMQCPQLDHAVIAIGWSVEQGSKRNIINVRNSWGPGWGSNGNFKIYYNEDNSANGGTCWLTKIAIVPKY